MLFLLILLCILRNADSQNPCIGTNLSNDPGLKITCNSILTWNKMSQQMRATTEDSLLPGIPGLSSVGSLKATAPNGLVDKYQCMDWQCVCSFIPGSYWDGIQCNMPGGTYMRKAVRKEYRALTAAERELQVYRQAFLAISKNGYYQQLSMWHSSVSTSPGAHAGPNFPVWHREFLKRFEIGMRTFSVNGAYPYASVSIPYWDSCMDSDVWNALKISPQNSMMFSSELMGNTPIAKNNETLTQVTNGQFAYFVGTLGPVFRALGSYGSDILMYQRDEVDDIVYQQQVNAVLAATAGGKGCPLLSKKFFEYAHGNIHVWVGGNMRKIITSTNDPIFFLHHSFVDHIFENWRQYRQTRSQRETEWNTGNINCYSPSHRFDVSMVPFTGMYNRDGLSNKYTDNMYSYNPRLTCDATYPCPQPYLWCNTAWGRCVAKIKPGSTCKLVNGIDPCFEGQCSSSTGNGICISRPGSIQKNRNPTKLVTTTRGNFSTILKYDSRSTESCYNGHECCGTWAKKNECRSSAPVMKIACRASCKLCTPKSYKLTDDCSNRHFLCQKYAMKGQCHKNAVWMRENCRKACNACQKSRALACSNHFHYLRRSPSIQHSPKKRFWNPTG